MGRILYSDTAKRLAERVCGQNHKKLGAAIMALRSRGFEEVWEGLPHYAGNLSRAVLAGEPVEYVGPKLLIWIEPEVAKAILKRPSRLLVATVRSGLDYMEVSSVRTSTLRAEKQIELSRQNNLDKAVKELYRQGLLYRERRKR